MPDWTYHPFLKPLLFQLEPETGRRVTLKLLELQSRTAIGRRIFRLFGHGTPPAALRVRAFGIDFPSPIGIAPGIDTHATAMSVMQYLGLGFVEVGPVGADAVVRRVATDPLRIVERHALAQSAQAGAPSAATVAARLRAAPALAIPVGVALRGARLIEAVRAADGAASFFTLPPACAEDLDGLRALRSATRTPLVLRLSPAWTLDRLAALLEAALEAGIDGAVALAGDPTPLVPDGELDGPFLRARSLAAVEFIARRFGDRCPVIGAGGLFTPEDAIDYLNSGAKLIELYSGFVYAGPGLPGRIVHALEARHPPRAPAPIPDSPSLPRPTLGTLAREGWPLVAITGAVLIGAGLFALILAATVKLLPYDVHYLGVSVRGLCDLNACRIVHFMAHDRVSFGGSIMAIGTLYVWLALAPLRERRAWAFWTLALSGAIGFGSFLTYLGFGYLDVWHGRATLALLPMFLLGLAQSWVRLDGPRGPAALFRPGARAWLWSPAGRGRACLTFAAFGMIAGGLTIMIVGMTRIFVPQDLQYMQITVEKLRALNPRLVPLIAHDRAGFGGGLCSGGITVLCALWCGARPGARGLWRALCASGVIGFGTAIGIHPIVGYNSFTHLAPAFAGAIAFVIGIILLRGPIYASDRPAGRFNDV